MSQHIGIEKVSDKLERIVSSKENFAPIFDYVINRHELARKYNLIALIDPYADTYYNTRQIIAFVEQLNELINELPDKEKEIAANIIKFVNDLQPHTFVYFIGD